MASVTAVRQDVKLQVDTSSDRRSSTCLKRGCELSTKKSTAALLKCAVCKKFLHLTCAGISSDDWETTPKSVKAQLSSAFICSECVLSSGRLTESTDVDSLSTELSDLKTSVAQNFEKMTASIEELTLRLTLCDSAAVVEDSPGGALTASLPQQLERNGEDGPTQQASWTEVVKRRRHQQTQIINEAVTVALRQVNEDTLTAKSLVVSGLPDRGNDKDDLEWLFSKLDRSLGQGLISDCFRMGPRDKDYPRLLKVHVVSSHVVKAVLDAAPGLKQVAQYCPELRRVFIRRSMSIKELTARKSLRAKCKNLNTKAERGQKFVVLTRGNDEMLYMYDGVDRHGNGGTREEFPLDSLSSIINIAKPPVASTEGNRNRDSYFT